jgi:DeoR family fructose operon transcriptional repressor
MEVAMIPYERQEKILEALAQDELLKIEQLQSILPTVSISTLRRDLKELEKSGRIVGWWRSEDLFNGFRNADCS